LKTSKLVKSELATLAHLVEGHFFKGGLTWTRRIIGFSKWEVEDQQCPWKMDKV